MNYIFIKENKDLVLKVLDFFCSDALNKSLHEKIKSMQRSKAKIKGGEYFTNIHSEWIYPDDYVDFYINEGVQYGKISMILTHLCNVGILISQKYGTECYQLNYTLFKNIEENDIVTNLIFGFGSIINRYEDSIFIIEVTNKQGDIEVGTGFYTSLKNDQNDEIYLVISNEHVVNNPNIKLLNRNKTEISIKNKYWDSNLDLAIIEVDRQKNVIPFVLSKKTEILSKIITMGYPRIPRTNNCYLVCHSGEINSYVENYSGNKLFLFSAKTSSGNSGSPVIDELGRVVGIVSKELFEKEQLEKNGKLPYYAAIPISELEKFIEKSIYYKLKENSNHLNTPFDQVILSFDN